MSRSNLLTLVMGRCLEGGNEGDAEEERGRERKREGGREGAARVVIQGRRILF